jgi:hypothetical protein
VTVKTDETQVVQQAVKTSLDTHMNSLQKTLADMRNDLHKVLGLMFQVEVQKTKAEIRINKERMKAKIEATRHEFQIQLKEIESRAK